MLEATIIAILVYLLAVALAVIGYEQEWLPAFFGKVEQRLNSAEERIFGEP